MGDAKIVRFVDKDGNELYQDTNHLSAVGANLVKAELVTAMIKHKPEVQRNSGK